MTGIHLQYRLRRNRIRENKKKQKKKAKSDTIIRIFRWTECIYTRLGGHSIKKTNVHNTILLPTCIYLRKDKLRIREDNANFTVRQVP